MPKKKSKNKVKIKKDDDNVENNFKKVTTRKKKDSIINKNEKNKPSALNNHLITDFYKVTRKRKTSKDLKEEQDELITYYLKNNIDDINSLQIKEFNGKGKGVITLKKFLKGTFICEYKGELIDFSDAKIKEEIYESQQLGCYMYYFYWNKKRWCIDATADTGRLGRLINHSRKNPNCKSKLFILNNIPHLIFYALIDINENTELLYDYGETDKYVIKNHPWIKNT